MRSLFRSLVLASLALGLVAAQGRAQTTKHFGIVGGVDFATFTGSGADATGFEDLGISASKGSLTGFIGGLYATIPLNEKLAFEPEILYEGKGSKYSLEAEAVSGTVDGELTFHLDYISVPLLLRYNFQPEGGLYGLAGFSVNFNISCSVAWSGDIADSLAVYLDIPGESDCPDMETYYGYNLGANTTFGGVVGLGFQKERFGLEGRYDFDFGEAYENSDGVKNAAWEILARIMIK